MHELFLLARTFTEWHNVELFAIWPFHFFRYFAFSGSFNWVGIITNRLSHISSLPAFAYFGSLALDHGHGQLISVDVSSKFAVCTLMTFQFVGGVGFTGIFQSDPNITTWRFLFSFLNPVCDWIGRERRCLLRCWWNLLWHGYLFHGTENFRICRVEWRGFCSSFSAFFLHNPRCYGISLLKIIIFLGYAFRQRCSSSTVWLAWSSIFPAVIFMVYNASLSRWVYASSVRNSQTSTFSWLSLFIS